MFSRWRAAKQNRIISEKRFEAIAHLEAKKYKKRIETLVVDNYRVSATVRTVSGTGTWRFTIDFDQADGVTGAYRIWSENDESTIPSEMAKGISNTIRAYLSETDGQPDKITSGTPLDAAIELEMARQESAAIRQKAVTEGSAIREEAEAEASVIREEANNEAESIRASANEYYKQRTAAAHEEAKAIRSRAVKDAKEIKKDATRIAEERRVIRARRRAFVSKHRKVLAGMCIGLVLLLALTVAFVQQGNRAKYEAKLIPVGLNSADCIGVRYGEIEAQLSLSGFTNISCIAMADLSAGDLEQEETTRFVTIDGNANFNAEEQFPYDAEVNVYYLTPQQLHAPITSADAVGMDVHAVEKKFTDAGFAHVKTVALNDLLVGFKEKPDSIAKITINDDEHFSCSDDLRPDVEIVIYYHTFRWSR